METKTIRCLSTIIIACITGKIPGVKPALYHHPLPLAVCGALCVTVTCIVNSVQYVVTDHTEDLPSIAMNIVDLTSGSFRPLTPYNVSVWPWASCALELHSSLDTTT